MAVALSTGWQTVKTGTSSFTYSSYTYNLRLEIQAYYQDISNTQARIRTRLRFSKSGSASWSGTNKHYRLRFYPDEGGTGDSGYNQDATTWGGGDVTYYLPSDSGTVYKTVNKGVNVTLSGYYFVDISGSSEINISENVFVPAPPYGLTATDLTPGTESFTATVSLSSWGSGSGTKYKELQCWTYDPSALVSPRRWAILQGSNLSDTITVDNNSDGTLNIVGNTLYTIGVYATNGSYATGSQRVGNYATLAYAPTLSVSAINTDSVTLSYTTQADGGYYAKNIQYSLDNGTNWTTAVTLNTGSVSTGTFTISGLAPNTAYTVKNRISTTAGEINGTDLTFTTLETSKFYGSVNGKSKKITTLYGSVNGKTKLVKKLYGADSNSKSVLVYQA